MSKRIVAAIEAIAFFTLTFCVIRWIWTQNGWFEPYTALCGLVFAALEIYRRWFATEERVSAPVPIPSADAAMSSEERADRYRRRKELFQQVRRRLIREKNNLDQLADDPKAAEGEEYTETTPFETIPRDLHPLSTYPEDEKLAQAIIMECQRILTLPSGGRSVDALMPLLHELDPKTAQWSNEAKVWSE